MAGVKGKSGKKNTYDRRGQKKLAVRLDEEVLDKFTEAAKKAGISKQLLLEDFVNEFIENNE